MAVAGSHFCGAPIENLFFVGPYWPSAGLTLLVNQFHGQLLFQATYAPDTVSERQAADFLDGWFESDEVKAVFGPRGGAEEQDEESR